MTTTSDEPHEMHAAPSGRVSLVAWLLLLVVLAVNLAIRWPQVGMPLERDEGEFAYGGQLLLEGDLPYQSLYALKWPGIYVAYALIEVVFGQTSDGIHRGLLVVTSWNIVWMFVIGRRLIDPLGGASAAAAFAALCLSPAIEPTSTQAEHFVLACALPGLYALSATWAAPRWGRWMSAGVCLGLATLMKQHGGLIAIAGLVGLGAGLLWQPRDKLRWLGSACAYLAGLFLPVTLASVLLAWRGAFDEFWFWTVEYALVYATHVPDLPNARGFWRSIQLQALPVWPLYAVAAWGFVLDLFGRARTTATGLVYAFSVASLVAVLPGRDFRAHYFLLLCPALALWVADGLRSIDGLLLARRSDGHVTGPQVEEHRRRRSAFADSTVRIVVLIAAIGWPLFTSARFLLSRSHVELCRTIYGDDPFSELPVVAEYLQRNTDPAEPVFVFGSQPQICFLSKRRSATGHVYLYPLLEAHDYVPRMQESLIEEVERARPTCLVVIHDWYMMPYTRREIFHWVHAYQRAHYELVGCAVVKSPTETVWLWGEEASRHGVGKFNMVDVFRRRE